MSARPQRPAITITNTIMTELLSTTSKAVEAALGQLRYCSATGLPIFMIGAWHATYAQATSRALQLGARCTPVEGEGLMVAGKIVTFFFSDRDENLEAWAGAFSEVKKLILATRCSLDEAKDIVKGLGINLLRRGLYVEEDPSQTAERLLHLTAEARVLQTALVANYRQNQAPWLVMMAVYHNKEQEIHLVMTVGEGEMPRQQDRAKMLDIEEDLWRYSKDIQQGQESTLQERYLKA